jgi:anti-sigma-K factor RskA
MSAEELIRSGLLEAHVLGQTTPEEARLVERMRASDPAVRAELEAIEIALEEEAMRSAVAPPPAVKNAVLDRIAAEGARPATPVIPIERPREHRFNWAVAASVAALLLSAVINFMQYRELRNVRSELARLENDRSVLAQELQVQRASLERSNQELAVLTAPQMRMVTLNGVGKAEGAKARIYWDKDAAAVHMHTLKLDAPPEGMQYQLWALVDGKPVDAGMMGLGPEGEGLQRMKDVPEAQAFAVTLERAGGSPVPTLEAMVLMGPV